MPARQMTVGSTPRTPPNTKARARIAPPTSHQGDSASSSWSGFSSTLADGVLEAWVETVEGVGEPGEEGVHPSASAGPSDVSGNSAAQKYFRET